VAILLCISGLLFLPAALSIFHVKRFFCIYPSGLCLWFNWGRDHGNTVDCHTHCIKSIVYVPVVTQEQKNTDLRNERLTNINGEYVWNNVNVFHFANKATNALQINQQMFLYSNAIVKAAKT
jgi:hypothetical protein